MCRRASLFSDRGGMRERHIHTGVEGTEKRERELGRERVGEAEVQRYTLKVGKGHFNILTILSHHIYPGTE